MTLCESALRAPLPCNVLPCDSNCHFYFGE